jgi:hypothetical protein
MPFHFSLQQAQQREVELALLREKVGHLLRVVAEARQNKTTTQPKTFKPFIEHSQPPEPGESTTEEQ